MPTAIPVSTSVPASHASRRASNSQLVPIALFCGIGLFVSLVAVIFGVQGAWY